MCRELTTESLPILIRSANNKNNHGQYRECFIPNPSSRSPTQLEMFRFFGAMIGWSIRSTSSLHLDLPPIFWKKILNIEANEMDLKFIDTYSWQVVQDLKKYIPLATSDSTLLFQSEKASQLDTTVSDPVRATEELVLSLGESLSD